MANISRHTKKSQNSILGDIIAERSTDRGDLLNALDFIESPSGLGLTLYPVQRVITRLMFGIPFDYKPISTMTTWKNVPVYDRFRENLLYEFTEEEFLKWLAEDGRCNISDWRDMPEGGYREAMLFVGRRGGKSAMVAAWASYVIYKMLHLENPTSYYNLIDGSVIDITIMAQGEEGATLVYDKLSGNVRHAPFFAPYLNPRGTMEFFTNYDLQVEQQKPSIKVNALPCTTNAARGPSSIFLVMDEYAHYRSEKGSTSEEIYTAATPATLQFVAPNGKRDSFVIAISSPVKKVGKMYDLHKLSMDEGAKWSTLAMLLSTAEANPRADSAYLREQYKKDPVGWKAEFGGEFLESTETYVPKSMVDLCSTKNPNVTTITPDCFGRKYFWGLDFGMAGDGCALAIGHLEPTPSEIDLVFDYIDRMMVGELFDGPGGINDGINDPIILADGIRYKNYKELVADEILAWLKHMHECLPCFEGATDQHGGRLLVQDLHRAGIKKIQYMHLSPALNSQMAMALKSYIMRGTARFPANPKFIAELMAVEAIYTNEYQIKVQAPAEKGSHDDMVDAAQMVAYQVQNWWEKHGKNDPTGRTLLLDQRAASPPSPLVANNGSLQDMALKDRMYRIRKNIGLPGFSIAQKPPWQQKGRGKPLRHA